MSCENEKELSNLKQLLSSARAQLAVLDNAKRDLVESERIIEDSHIQRQRLAEELDKLSQAYEEMHSRYK